MGTRENTNIKDFELEEKIGFVLKEKLAVNGIRAIVRDGYVYLLGSVDSFDKRKEIAAIVQKIPGVVIVTNHIHCKPLGGIESFLHF